MVDATGRKNSISVGFASSGCPYPVLHNVVHTHGWGNKKLSNSEVSYLNYFNHNIKCEQIEIRFASYFWILVQRIEEVVLVRSVPKCLLKIVFNKTSWIICPYSLDATCHRRLLFCRLVSSAVGFRDEYLTWNTLKRWCLDIVKKVKGLTTSVEKSDAPAGESPAVEVLKFRDNKGLFSS